LGLTQKILFFTGALIVALVGITLAFTTVQADRLARDTIREGLQETREVWKAIQADRFDKLRLGVRVLANDPYFKAALTELDQATTLDSLAERGMDLDADFMLATDWDGVLVARTDNPAASGDDLSEEPLVMAAFEGEESATLWQEGEGIATAVAVPMLTGPEFVGVLVAGYVIDEEVAAQIRRLTRSEIAYVLQDLGQPRLVVSSLGPREGALNTVLNAPELVLAGEEPFEIDLAGERFIGVRIPLLTSDEEEIGAALALRSLSAETAGFRQFRKSLIAVSLGVMVLALPRGPRTGRLVQRGGGGGNAGRDRGAGPGIQRAARRPTGEGRGDPVPARGPDRATRGHREPAGGSRVRRRDPGRKRGDPGRERRYRAQARDSPVASARRGLRRPLRDPGPPG
jgi:hypothetical protein